MSLVPTSAIPRRLVRTLEQAFLHCLQPVHSSIAFATFAHLPRSKTQRIAENALLRQLWNILYGQVAKSRFRPIGLKTIGTNAVEVLDY
jgi:hypothetical protein